MGRASHLRLRRDPSPRPVLGLLVAALVGLALLDAPPANAAADAPTARPLLTTRLDAALTARGLDPARTAALAVDLRSGEVVYSRNPTLSLVPASTQKLAVAYAALAVLGPGYRFQTEVVGTGGLLGDVWNGDLYLRGYGDPTLTAADVDDLAAGIASWGVRHVTGAVIGDESWFDSVRTGPGWRGRFYIGESPPLSALAVSRARYRGRTAANPPLAAAALLRHALAARGVRVAKPSRIGMLAAPGLPLAHDTSEPLARIVRFMGRESDNYTAELLLKQLGAVVHDAGTTAAGARVVRAALAAAGVPLAGVRVADGSGLSSLDRLTAEAVVALLQAGLARADVSRPFLDALAVAGVDGTLRRRLQVKPARGRVIAKTGTTRLACALSGFVRDRYVFAILQNGSPVATSAAREAQDRFALLLAAAP